MLSCFLFSSGTFEDLDKTVEVPYTQGRWHAYLGSDMVAMAASPDLRVRAEVACITQSDSFFINDSHWQGILGLGYKEIVQVCRQQLFLALL